MYGLVNIAIRDMVIEGYGVKTWDAIRRKAGVEVDNFVSMQDYPDEVTYKLVGAGSAVLDLPTDKILFGFGEYWVPWQKAYGDLMSTTGGTLPDFVENLNDLHVRLALIMPNLKPPRFECTNRSKNSIDLHYFSERPGLAPFVEGVLSGLGQLFQCEVSIDHIATRNSEGADHDIFRLKWQ
ncbi:MAG: heme NO-binding domain-containing protein [Candidatus Latescibacteria bacterium]|jgi:hypothetical protein|nr:heme NO-binding domain-containing protein [Candidatus Latescibacterota bacterium]